MNNNNKDPTSLDEVMDPEHAEQKKRDSIHRNSSLRRHFKFTSSSDKSNTPCNRLSFNVGVSENKNSKFRPTMEDVHTYVANFAERLDWGYFAIFDGHAGKDSARWCGSHLHDILYDNIALNDNVDLRDNLNKSFQEADEKISREVSGSSGCTAAVAVIRWEEEIDDDDVTSPSATSMTSPTTTTTTTSVSSNDHPLNSEPSQLPVSSPPEGSAANNTSDHNKETDGQSHANTNDNGNPLSESSSKSPSPVPNHDTHHHDSKKKTVDPKETPFDFIPTKKHKRMLYTANVGDSRLVLSRGGEAKRLSYDHKSSDKLEQQRVRLSGGLMLKNRVNGVLAVTRSLGDSYMKNLVIGSPYTTSTELQEDDEFLIIACDGLWDVVTDQEAVDRVKDVTDPKHASSLLCTMAMERATTDNVTVMVVRFDTRVFDFKTSV
ncbi:unnamed protein product [Ambrosiozyma monospora]|uniref:Unnamed protein product n=1 Tax=Ambrosiozyma monospora TaxID=43982 RepID=A0ACB5T891_AMBMO|nr:unnamed protein product [Ambrosiozyma monospora]